MTSVPDVRDAGYGPGSPAWTLVAYMGAFQLVWRGMLHSLIALFATPIRQELAWTSARVQTAIAFGFFIERRGAGDLSARALALAATMTGAAALLYWIV